MDVSKLDTEASWPIPAIDALRGFAALGVAMAHFGQQEISLADYGPFGLWIYQLGTWGVTIFFILSGFCIHGATLSAFRQGRGVRWKVFFKRRIFRIYPAFLAALVFAGISAQYYQTELLKSSSWSASIKHLLLISNFSPHDRCSLNGVLWSVVMECHFYLLYPAYLYIIRRVGDFRAFGIVFVLGWIYFITVTLLTSQGDFRVAMQFTFPALWWKWCLGALLAKIYFSPDKKLRPLLNIPYCVPILLSTSFVCALFKNGALVLSFQRIALPFILAAFLITLVNKPQRSKNVLGIGGVGIVSYSIYLFHPIVLAPFSLHSTGAWFIDILIFMGATVLLGWIGYHSIEKPCMTIGRRGESRRN